MVYILKFRILFCAVRGTWGKGQKAFNQGAGMTGAFQADFISSFNINCTAIYEQYGIDEMLRYLLYIAQQIAPIKRINIVCTTDSGEVVIPVGDSSRENFYRIVTSQTHRYPLISRENISQTVDFYTANIGFSVCKVALYVRQVTVYARKHPL